MGSSLPLLQFSLYFLFCACWISRAFVVPLSCLEPCICKLKSGRNTIEKEDVEFYYFLQMVLKKKKMTTTFFRSFSCDWCFYKWIFLYTIYSFCNFISGWYSGPRGPTANQTYSHRDGEILPGSRRLPRLLR